jgi:hypothetical protein
MMKWKPGFSGKMFCTLEILFKTGFTVFPLQGSKENHLVTKTEVCNIRIPNTYIPTGE